ncbi:MAG: InlB B-repeat-containing protein [Clostridia bacterium]
MTLKEEYAKSIAVRGMQLIDVREYVAFTGVDADVWPDNAELVYEEQNPTVIYIGMVKPWLCKSDYYGGTQTVKLALNNGTTDQKIIELPFTVKGANTTSTSFIGLREKTHFNPIMAYGEKQTIDLELMSVAIDAAGNETLPVKISDPEQYECDVYVNFIYSDGEVLSEERASAATLAYVEGDKVFRLTLTVPALEELQSKTLNDIYLDIQPKRKAGAPALGEGVPFFCSLYSSIAVEELYGDSTTIEELSSHAYRLVAYGPGDEHVYEGEPHNYDVHTWGLDLTPGDEVVVSVKDAVNCSVSALGWDYGQETACLNVIPKGSTYSFTTLFAVRKTNGTQFYQIKNCGAKALNTLPESYTLSNGTMMPLKTFFDIPHNERDQYDLTFTQGNAEGVTYAQAEYDGDINFVRATGSGSPIAFSAYSTLGRTSQGGEAYANRYDPFGTVQLTVEDTDVLHRYWLEVQNDGLTQATYAGRHTVTATLFSDSDAGEHPVVLNAADYEFLVRDIDDTDGNIVEKGGASEPSFVVTADGKLAISYQAADTIEPGVNWSSLRFYVKKKDGPYLASGEIHTALYENPSDYSKITGIALDPSKGDYNGGRLVLNAEKNTFTLYYTIQGDSTEEELKRYTYDPNEYSQWFNGAIKAVATRAENSTEIVVTITYDSTAESELTYAGEYPIYFNAAILRDNGGLPLFWMGTDLKFIVPNADAQVAFVDADIALRRQYNQRDIALVGDMLGTWKTAFDTEGNIIEGANIAVDYLYLKGNTWATMTTADLLSDTFPIKATARSLASGDFYAVHPGKVRIKVTAGDKAFTSRVIEILPANRAATKVTAPEKTVTLFRDESRLLSNLFQAEDGDIFAVEIEGEAVSTNGSGNAIVGCASGASSTVRAIPPFYASPEHPEVTVTISDGQNDHTFCIPSKDFPKIMQNGTTETISDLEFLWLTVADGEESYAPLDFSEGTGNTVEVVTELGVDATLTKKTGTTFDLAIQAQNERKDNGFLVIRVTSGGKSFDIEHIMRIFPNAEAMPTMKDLAIDYDKTDMDGCAFSGVPFTHYLKPVPTTEGGTVDLSDYGFIASYEGLGRPADETDQPTVAIADGRVAVTATYIADRGVDVYVYRNSDQAHCFTYGIWPGLETALGVTDITDARWTGDAVKTVAGKNYLLLDTEATAAATYMAGDAILENMYGHLFFEAPKAAPETGWVRYLGSLPEGYPLAYQGSYTVKAVNPGTVRVMFMKYQDDGSHVSASSPELIVPTMLTGITLGDIPAALEFDATAETQATLDLKTAGYVTIAPNDATEPLAYLSSDATVASVDEQGVVTPVKPGTATITVKAAFGKTEGIAKTLELTITAKGLTDDMIAAISSVEYTGTAHEPTVTVTANNQVLTLNTDYTVSYADNTNVGTATVTVTGKENYAGVAVANFQITAIALTESMVTGVPTEESYTGSPITGTLVVNNGQTSLVLNTDYTVAYQNNVNAGTATVTVTGIGNYGGVVTKTFTIAKKALADAMIAAIPDQPYTGNAITPALVVTDGNRALVVDVDYTVAHEDNTNVGTDAAKVTITAKEEGNYSGTAQKTFAIVAALQAAPTKVTAVAPTVRGKADGKLTGLTTSMEYKAASAQGYTAATGTAVTGLSAGAYLVRYAADANHAASLDATVNIPDGAETLTVTFDPNYAGASKILRKGLSYNAKVSAPTLSRAGYSLEGWYKEKNEWDFTTSQVTENITLTAKWTPSTGIPYKVEHYQEAVEGGYPLTPTASEDKQGTVDQDTVAAVKAYDGFTAEDFTQKTIAADGSTVVKIYYTRNFYTLTFKAQDGDGDYEELMSGKVKFGTPISAPTVRVEGRIFTGWGEGVTIPSTMPAEDKTFTATTIAADVSYTVNHMQQNVTDEDYTLFQTETIVGASGAQADNLAKAAVKRYDGFTYDCAELSGTTLTLQYTRNSYALTIGSSTGVTLGEDTQAANHKFGATVTVKATGTAEGYKWLRWESSDQNALVSSPNPSYKFTMPAKAITLTPLAEKERYTLTFDANGGVGGTTQTVEFGANITAPTVTRQGYTQNGWDTAVAQTMPAANTTYKAQWTANTNTPYTVEHYQEALNGKFALVDTEAKTDGTTGGKTAAGTKTYEGFTFKGTLSDQQQTIAADGSTVVKLYYTRNAHKLTFALGYGDEPSIVIETVKYGTPIMEPTFTRAGYTRAGWDPEVPATMPDADATYAAQWTEKADTPYTVEHQLQKLDGAYETREVEKKIGTTAGQTAAAAKTYEGFTAPGSVTQQNIKADGTTNIVIQYTRNSHDLRFGSASAVSTKYGAPIAAPADPTKSGYTFAGWQPAVPQAMPDYALTFTATWVPGAGTAYKVEHYTETLTGIYEVKRTDNLKGVTGQTATASPITLEGFAYDATKTGNTNTGAISADGNLTLKLYYARNSYTLTFDAAGGAGGKAESVKYGAPITAPSLTRSGYAQNGFTPALPATMPAANATYTAIWTPGSDTVYTVVHHMETLLGDYGDQSETLKGTTGATVKAEARTLTGFTLDQARSTQSGVVAADGSLTLHLYYARNVHTLTFDANGGEGGYTAQMKFGQRITPPDPIKQGYSYTWDASIPGTMPDRGLLCRAIWTANNNTVYWEEHYKENLDGTYEEAPSDLVMKRGTTDASATLASMATENVSDAYFGFEAKTPAVSGTIAGDGSLRLRAYYPRKVFKVIIDLGNGMEAEFYAKFGAMITQQRGSVSKALDANKDGTETVVVPMPQGAFNGWTVSTSGKTAKAAGEVAIPARVTGNIKLTAEYGDPKTESQYTVRHQLAKGNGFALTDSDTRYAKAGTSVTAVPRNYEGYMVDSSKPLTGTVKADGSLVINIYYNAQVYPVTVDGGTVSRGSSFAKGASVTVTASKVTGHEFVSWQSDNAAVPASTNANYTFTMPASPVNLTAVTKAKRYDVTYALAGGSFPGGTAPSSYTYGVGLTLPTPEKEGWAFGGWTLENKKVTEISKAQTGNVTLTATWAEIKEATSLSLDKSKAIKVGASVVLTATVEPTDANDLITWASDKPNFATVSVDGNVTGVAAGVATITATIDGGRLQASCVVTVESADVPTPPTPPTEKVPATGVTLTPSELTIKEGKTSVLIATVLPENATNKNVIWTSDNLQITTVAQGTIAGVKGGETTIRVKTEDGGFEASCRVTVTKGDEPEPPAKEGTLIPDRLVIGVGAKVKGANLLPPNFAGKPEFVCEDAKVLKAHADKKGNVTLTAVKVGETKLTVRFANGATKTIPVEVVAKKLAVSEIVSAKSITMKPLQTRELTPTVKPAGAKDKALWMISGNPAIVSVDDKGVLTAKKPGKTSIYLLATSGKLRKIAVTVKKYAEIVEYAIDETEISLSVGDKHTLQATVLPLEASQTVKWKVKNPKIATVKGNVLIAKKAGTTKVTCTFANGKKLSRAVTVK